MPIYEYVCGACGHQLEEMQGFNDEPLVKCPSCNKRKLQKIVSAPSFHLKGTGWYVTDFKNSGKKENPPKESDKKSEKQATEKTATSSETTKKSETKSE